MNFALYFNGDSKAELRRNNCIFRGLLAIFYGDSKLRTRNARPYNIIGTHPVPDFPSCNKHDFIL